MSTRRRLASGIALSLALLGVRAAAAFPTGEQFDADALTEDGGGGLAFSGGPLGAGHTCAVCHTAPPGRVRLRLEADPVDLFDDGYAPDATYRMRVVLEDQWAAAAEAAAGDDCGPATTPYRRCDENGFALEITAASGAPVGSFAAAVGNACPTAAPAAADVHLLASGAGVTHSGTHAGRTSWELCWTAPGPGAGTVTAHLAAVDGGGGDGTPANPEDVTGDDVVAGAVAFAERGRDPRIQGGGCAVGGDAGAGLAVALALTLLLLRRPRGRRALAVVATLAALATGCVTVKPHQKQDLAKRKMVFAPDATEDELDLHMQESREGSAGGYGSAGGGCGCN